MRITCRLSAWEVVDGTLLTSAPQVDSRLGLSVSARRAHLVTS
jgi:hypothetical protein